MRKSQEERKKLGEIDISKINIDLFSLIFLFNFFPK